MASTAPKEGRLHIRCDHESRDLLDKAAAYTRVSVSEFVLTHALESAEQVVQAHERITLSPKGFQEFLEALDKPRKPNAAVTRAYRRHAKQVRE